MSATPCSKHAPAFSETCPDCLFALLVEERQQRREAETMLEASDNLSACLRARLAEAVGRARKAETLADEAAVRAGRALDEFTAYRNEREPAYRERAEKAEAALAALLENKGDQNEP